MTGIPGDGGLDRGFVGAFGVEPDALRGRAMPSLFEALDKQSEGTVAVDRDARVTWINAKYARMLGIADPAQAIGREVEEIIPNSQMRQVIATGQPILLDLMRFGAQRLVVSRFPLIDDDGAVVGAVGFVLYDSLHRLKPLLAELSRLEAELAATKRRLDERRQPRYSLQSYVGDSPACLEVKRRARLAARSDAPILLMGETGTGKELIAQSIHVLSARSGRPFVGVNVAAIPDTLLEAEFFGAVAGAYTGMDRRGREGRFKTAEGGTLFLDEIGDMPLGLQAKLLRALQEQEVEPLGSDRPIKIDVRVIAATNVDLEQRILEGRFRADLYYRLNVLPIRLPSLAEMGHGLEAIAESVLQDIASRTGLPARGLTPEAVELLSRHPWPGNVRELRNVLERACLLTDNPRLTVEDLAEALPTARCGAMPVPAAARLPLEVTPLPGAVPPVPDALPDYDSAFDAFERDLLRRALALSDGKAEVAARRLGVSRAAFYKKLARLGLRAKG
ncbi:sigma-54 interaction domain-containing protein [Azospirillum griseum]|uniref:PAS domain-containing protein n=1 Tax=Azospirillum griseum TaxID=2496639 RepID=A0A3S0KX25_9PROT|nr:sigma 54-interacting transcriptional regulator [Azospirillum griseum]RTR18368.1 PAS domain-containing protein [Azospirillum griseum]